MALIGAICGDIVGSIYEFHNLKKKEFPLFGEGCDFTDDTVMTMAVADWCINGGDVKDYLVKYGHTYKLPKGGYGGMFRKWLFETKDEDRKPYNSWGNGSAMRVAACGWLYDTEEETLKKAEESAVVTHNHPFGIQGAQAVAIAIYKLRHGTTKHELKKYIKDFFGYNLDRTCEEIRINYKFDSSCQGSVPEAFVSFLEADSFEDAIRNAISLGGDSDTIGAICGALAEAYYNIPQEIEDKVKTYIPKDFITLIDTFNALVESKKTAISGETMQKKQLYHEVKDLCEVRGDKPIIPICVDFDGTIVKHDYPNIGAPNPMAIETMREFTDKYNVGWILDTMRPTQLMEEAVHYLTKHGIKLYGKGINPSQKRWTDSPKAYAPFSIDDRNVGVPLIYEDNEAPYVDWKKIREILIPMLEAIIDK